MKTLPLMLSLVLLFTTPLRAETIEKTPAQLCAALDQAFQKRKWGKDPCQMAAEKDSWKVGGTSVHGRPLMYTVYGDPKATNTTLIFSMIHGDEVTPLYIGFEIAAWAKENMASIPNTRLVVAPLLNPDGFMGLPKTRTNANGVDCNRNFATKDWEREALRSWKGKYHSEKRRFPGNKPNSEPETQFQKMLIEKFNPQKIVSIHSPLHMIDYDGPDQIRLSHFSKDYVQKCQEFRKKLKASPSGFFPGSLGNFAGQELGIPTITLELPTARADKAKEYWKQLKQGLVTAVTYVVPPKDKD